MSSAKRGRKLRQKRKQQRRREVAHRAFIRALERCARLMGRLMKKPFREGIFPAMLFRRQTDADFPPPSSFLDDEGLPHR